MQSTTKTTQQQVGSAPPPIVIEHAGRVYRAHWHKASSQYRFRANGRKERLYGPDPGEAYRRLTSEIGDYMDGQFDRSKRSRKSADRPAKIPVKTILGNFTLHDSRSGYRTSKIFGSYKYFGRDPLEAPDRLRDAVLLLMHPELAVDVEESEPEFLNLEAVLTRWLVTKELKAKSRYQSYKSNVKVILKEASPEMKRQPLDGISQRQWVNLQDRLFKRQRAESTRKNTCHMMREIFRYYEALTGIKLVHTIGLFDSKTVTDGRDQTTIRPDRFEVEEIHNLLSVADPQWRAMILWGVNGAFEPLDLSHLRWEQVDLESGWFEGVRMKRPRKRRFKMWRETIDALVAWQAVCGQQEHDFVFTRPNGRQWKTRETNDPIFNQHFRTVQELAGVYISKRSFYALRHSFQAFAGKCRKKDSMAIDAVMGHEHGLDHVYDPIGDDPHIELVCEFTRRYILFGEGNAHEYAKAWQQYDDFGGAPGGDGPQPVRIAG